LSGKHDKSGGVGTTFVKNQNPPEKTKKTPPKVPNGGKPPSSFIGKKSEKLGVRKKELAF